MPNRIQGVALSVAVIIATVDRHDALRRALTAVHGQTLSAIQVVICPPDASTLPEDVRNDPRNTIIDGVKGSTFQRNLAASLVGDEVEYIAYFDDDAIPRNDYLAHAVTTLEMNPEAVGLTGNVVRDGAAEGRELTPHEITAALAGSWTSHSQKVAPVRSLYGCNMVFRASAVRSEKFDERLPLYGWLEDLDYSRRVSISIGAKLLKDQGAVIVHQGSASGGRTQHRRLGYSQVSNYEYLRRKGVVSMWEGVALVGRPIAASLFGALYGPETSNRRERLHGMWLALCDVARGHVTPERIVDL